MSKISVVMAAYNSEQYISEAIESVLKQSFDDFEFIIVNDGSTDNTVNIIRSFSDKRILLIEKEHNYIESLNAGMKKASGMYIARMDSDDIMHIDRLKIQNTIMDEESSITVCCSSMITFGDNISKGSLFQMAVGIIEHPLIQFVNGNMISNPTAMIRKDFLDMHALQYVNYPYAEDYKFWIEIAKRGGIFYTESQPLLYYRISETQISNTRKEKQQNISYQIKQEIIRDLICQNQTDYPDLSILLKTMNRLDDQKIISPNDTIRFFFNLFWKNKNNLKIEVNEL